MRKKSTETKTAWKLDVFSKFKDVFSPSIFLGMFQLSYFLPSGYLVGKWFTQAHGCINKENIRKHNEVKVDMNVDQLSAIAINSAAWSHFGRLVHGTYLLHFLYAVPSLVLARCSIQVSHKKTSTIQCWSMGKVDFNSVRLKKQLPFRGVHFGVREISRGA